MSRIVAPSLFWVLAMMPVAALAQTVPLTQDAYLTPGNGTNYGANPTINVGGPGGSNALVQFDLSTLPSGITLSNVAEATLALYVNRLGEAGSINISETNGPWTESAVNGNSSVVAGSAVASGVSILAAGVYVYVDATQEVKDWLGGATNSGFFVAPNGAGVNVAFDSKERVTTSHPATLTVMLMSMGPVGATGPQGPSGQAGAIGAAGTGGGCIAAPIALLYCWTANGTYGVGAEPSGVAFDGANMWVVNQAGVTKILAQTGAVVDTYGVGLDPSHAAFDGANIWVTNYSSNNVTKLLALTGAVVGTYGVGSGPLGVAFDGANIWVTNADGNNVTKLLASTGAVVGAYPVGITPAEVAFDGTNIWVTNQGDNSVTSISHTAVQ